MHTHRTALLIGVFLLAGSLWPVANANAQPAPSERAGDIWDEDTASPTYPWWYRWLSDEMVDRIMKGIAQRDPAKARELAELRKKDPEQFKTELGWHGRKEIEEISRERFEARRQRRHDDFVEWLKTNYPQDEAELAKVREKDPQLYVRNLEHLLERYGRIFEAYSANPELGDVLKEDYDLRKRRDEILQQMRRERSGARRHALGTELQDIVARRYDLIVRRKEIAYEQLQKKLEEIQRLIEESKSEIVKWQDAELKRENVRKRIEALTEGMNRRGFKWD
ncbi:hypothetical protein [Anaerobaca lacustris]|uniref:DUF5667 domain-containing protein n=1 Tax=Anaerobaca lacustris TaxID=3044600 RepID=A0AAW6U1X0_9BACT|nr:hypothetical protein [Sedimentisphaerales bacterium M17dextr]